MPKPALIDSQTLRMALVGYEQEKARLESAIADVRTQLGQPGSEGALTATDGMGEAAPKRRTMSRAAKKRIAAAQRKRWAAARAEKDEVAKPAEKPKRKLSAAGRAAIIAATKKRWAAVHKAQKAAKNATPKSAARKGAPKKPRKAALKVSATPATAAPVAS